MKKLTYLRNKMPSKYRMFSFLLSMTIVFNELKNYFNCTVLVKKLCMLPAVSQMQLTYRQNQFQLNSSLQHSLSILNRKSKDDLFDDIFSKEDPETGDDNDIAKMYGKFEDTSPKKEFFKKHKITTSSDRKGLEASEERSPKKTPKLKLEGGKYNGRKTKSPKIKSHQESVIPGSEEVQIPGLESNKERKEKSKEFDVNVSKIPLLFDDESVNTTKHDGIPKTPELSPSKERNVRKKQPYTPPEDFTDEIGNNELNNDSPYNPEDLTPMDMGLSPIDANLIQQEALKGAVELKLKEPFSGFENPTWQKIIEAKSKHEAKRQKYKEYESSEKADEINSKDDSKSWKQVRSMFRN